LLLRLTLHGCSPPPPPRGRLPAMCPPWSPRARGMHRRALRGPQFPFPAQKERRAMKTVVGLFDSTSDAQGMLQELIQMGFQADDISIVTNVGAQQKVEAGEIHLDSMNLVDVGKIAAGGPLRETLKRSSGTSLALRGALERSGFPADLADRYASGVE